MDLSDRRLFRAPIIRHLPIVVDILIARAVGPIPIFVFPEFGGVLELVLSDVDLITAKLLVVTQDLRRERCKCGDHAIGDRRRGGGG
jgi:hypothetical protein